MKTTIKKIKVSFSAGMHMEGAAPMAGSAPMDGAAPMAGAAPMFAK
jgi:hypothetical protein